MSEHNITAKAVARQAKSDFCEAFLSFFRPKIVMPSYEDAPIPASVQRSILAERTVLMIRGERLAAETEALWYLSTASLACPIGREFHNIMLYLCRKWQQGQGRELPDFLACEVVLEDQEERELYRLRKWLYEQGMKAVKQRTK